MKRGLFGVLAAGTMVAPAAFGQSPPPANPPTQATPAPMAAQPLTGTPPGFEPLAGQVIRTFSIQRIEGQPIETRPPEKADDHPLFAGQTRAPYHASKPFNTTVLTDKFENPWSMAFLPDGKILVTEKPGHMRTLDKQGVISAPISGVPAVVFNAEAGLQDVALDPNFAKNRRLFLSYNAPVGADGNTTAIASAVLSADDTALTDVKVIFQSSPVLPKAMPNNLGGRIAIARDGTLFLAVGDRSKSPPWDVAQKLDTDLGKIVHITADGRPAPGNPFAGKPGALPEIWATGQRSQEGLAFAPDGQLWETENGPRGGDELNKISPGKNYGWPVAVHGIDYTQQPITAGVVDAPGTEQARYYWDPVIAPSGLAFYSGNLFPQWKNSVFVGALRGKMIDRLTLDGDKVVSEEPLLTERNLRFRDVRMGPEGALYVLSESGVLLKLTPQ